MTSLRIQKLFSFFVVALRYTFYTQSDVDMQSDVGEREREKVQRVQLQKTNFCSPMKASFDRERQYFDESTNQNELS